MVEITLSESCYLPLFIYFFADQTDDFDERPAGPAVEVTWIDSGAYRVDPFPSTPAREACDHYLPHMTTRG